jgi:transposase
MSDLVERKTADEIKQDLHNAMQNESAYAAYDQMWSALELIERLERLVAELAAECNEWEEKYDAAVAHIQDTREWSFRELYDPHSFSSLPDDTLIEIMPGEHYNWSLIETEGGLENE